MTFYSNLSLLCNANQASYPWRLSLVFYLWRNVGWQKFISAKRWYICDSTFLAV